jgi:hypothetical protein
VLSVGDSDSHLSIFALRPVLSAGDLVIYFHVFTEDRMLSVGDTRKFVVQILTVYMSTEHLPLQNMLNFNPQTKPGTQLTNTD